MAVTAIRVEAAVPGRRRAGTAEHPLALPIPEGGTVVLRDFIDAVVRAEIASFRARAEMNSVLRVLTERQIAEGLEAGAIRSGDSEAATDVDEDAAVATCSPRVRRRALLGARRRRAGGEPRSADHGQA